MSLFKVHATQEQEMVFFVEAPDFETAKADAEELVESATSGDWAHADTSVWTYQARNSGEPDKYDSVWTGGPNGEWTTGWALKEEEAERNDKIPNA